MFLIPPRVWKAARQIRIEPAKRIHAQQLGQFESKFRGTGMEFKDFRLYSPGDDIRHLSWTVSARAGKPMLKTFQEEREFEVACLTDGSGSMMVGSPSKWKTSEEIVSALGLACLQQGHRFSFALFTDRVTDFIPSGNRRETLLRALGVFRKAQPLRQRTRLEPALRFLCRRLRHPSLVLILSDFQSTEPLESCVATLSLHHEVYLCHLLDPIDSASIFPALYAAQNPEDMALSLFDLNSSEIRQKIRQEQVKTQTQIQKTAQKAGAQYIQITTTPSPLDDLVRFFRQRPRGLFSIHAAAQ